MERVRAALRDLASGLTNQVTRAKHVLSAYSTDGERTMAQVETFAGEVHRDIELLMPYGRSGLPKGSEGDLIILQVNASRDHKVALVCDDPTIRIPGLAAGEFGDRDANGTQIVYRDDRLEITTPKKLVVTVTGDGTVTIGGNVAVAITGNAAITVQGNCDLTSSARIKLTAPAGTITANGNVLG